MIFTDVLILILSMLVSDRYELVFRNAAFIGSTILIRASLTIARPYSAPIAVFAMVFGILTLLVYNYHSRLRERQRPA
jgi:Zn-dependent protease with chaperone function